MRQIYIEEVRQWVESNQDNRSKMNFINELPANVVYDIIHEGRLFEDDKGVLYIKEKDNDFNN